MHVALYRSRARPGLMAADLNAIIAAAERKNRALDVTGLLLYGQIPAIPGAPGEFVQWIEGPEAAVRTLLREIEDDDRHFDLDVLAEGTVEAVRGESGRLFPAWSMGLVRLSELPATRGGFLRFTATWDRHVLAAAA